MTKEDQITTMRETLKRLDLATDCNNTALVVLRSVPKAGKSRYSAQITARTPTPTPPKYCPERNQRIAKARAIRNMQEIAHSSNLFWFVTLTFEDEVMVNQAKKMIQEAKRSKALTPFGPYIYVIEGWKEGDRVHIHALVDGSTAENLKTHWPHGTVDVRKVSWEEIDYICTYMGKDFADLNRPKGNRYSAAKGIKPKTEVTVLPNELEVYKHILEISEGRELTSKWSNENSFGRHGEIVWNPNNNYETEVR